MVNKNLNVHVLMIYYYINSFNIINTICKNLFYTIYSVKNNNGEYLALKHIKITNKNSRNHAFKEACILKIASEINHPNIICPNKIIHFGYDMYYVLPLCPNGYLFDFSKQKRILSEIETACIVKHIMLGVQVLHLYGRLYLDIKLENILIDSTQ